MRDTRCEMRLNHNSPIPHLPSCIPHHDSPFLRQLPLVIEEPFFSPDSAAVSAERAVGADDTMAGNDDTHDVVAVRPANRARHLGVAQFLRHPGIGTRLADGNCLKRLPVRSRKGVPTEANYSL